MRVFISVAVAAVCLVLAAADAVAAGGHWCRQGDPPIFASARTPCAVAGSVVTAYVNVCRESRSCRMSVMTVGSRRLLITCRRNGSRYGGTVSCGGPAGISTRFSSLI